jgi:hypothetical protein
VWDLPDAASERRENYGGVPYKPGGDLHAVRFIAEPTRRPDAPRLKELLRSDPRFVADSFWPDGMVSVSGREYNGLIESPCYLKVTDHANTMTCMSCHTMHRPADDARPVKVWAEDQLKPGMDTNLACVQCHASYRNSSALKAHTRHAETSSGSNCYNCHMPYTTYGLLKAIRSHQVSSPSVQSNLETGRPNACNLCHLDKSLGWTAARLEAWFGMPAAALSDDDRTLPSGAVWMLRGDAQQRALAAYSAGWTAAQEVAGSAWMVPILERLANDPYEAVRFIAQRTRRSLSGTRGGQTAVVVDAATADRLRAQRDDRRVFLRE